MTDYEALRPYATPRQLECIDAINETGSHRKAAKRLGINMSNLTRGLQALRRRAAQQGYSPEHDMTRTVPDGFKVKGVSTYYDQDGKVRGQWVKSQTDRERQQALMLEAMQTVGDDFRGKSKTTAAPKRTSPDLLTVYPFGDPHIGMYAWAKETGADFDCAIAERRMVEAVDRLVLTAPATDTAILLSVGDFYHADTTENKSLNSGHSFDVDTRWVQVLGIGVRAMRRCIDKALEKHKRVIVRCMSGNHDYHTSQMLGLCLSMYYEKNRRVEVDTSPSYFWFHRFGKVLIGSTHGDTAKPEQLPAIMADEVPADWGATDYRYWYTGHIHTRNVAEFRGCVWESFRTLASRDAWHAKMGYRAGRDLYAIVHHREYGEVERHRVDVAMLA